MDVDSDDDNVICIFQIQSHTVVEFVGNINLFGIIILWAFEKFRLFVFWLFFGCSVILTVFGSTNLCYFWNSFVRFLFYMSNLEGWQRHRVLASTKFAKSKNSLDAFHGDSPLCESCVGVLYWINSHVDVVISTVFGFTEGCWCWCEQCTFIASPRGQRVVEDVGNINWIGIYWSLDCFCAGFGVEIESFKFWCSAILAIFVSTDLCYCWKSKLWFAINISNLEGWQCSRLLLSTKLAKFTNFPDPFIVWVMSWRLYHSTIFYLGVVNFLVMLEITEGCWWWCSQCTLNVSGQCLILEG